MHGGNLVCTRDLFNFRLISDNVSETVQDRIVVL